MAQDNAVRGSFDAAERRGDARVSLAMGVMLVSSLVMASLTAGESALMTFTSTDSQSVLSPAFRPDRERRPRAATATVAAVF